MATSSLAILNQKGGVGKTTTAVNLAVALSESGQRVLLIDIDPQAHATLHLGITPPVDDPAASGSDTEDKTLARGSMYDVLICDADLNEVWAEVSENLFLVSSHIDLAAAEIELASVVGREVILRDKLAEVEDQFDYIIFDCPPSLGILTLNTLAAVREVYLPMQPHFLALHGLSKLLSTIAVVAKRLNPNLRLTGVVFCMYDSGTRLAAEVSRDVTEFFQNASKTQSPWSTAKIFQTQIRRNIRLAEAPSFGQSIFDYDNSSNGAEDYRKLAQEVMQRSLAKDENESSPDVIKASA